MISHLIVTLCLGAASLPAQEVADPARGPGLNPEAELRIERFDDGAPRVERSVRAAAEGEQAHGPYVRYHPGGQVAAEGAYTEGRMDGPWTTYWPDGTVKTRGDFLDGRRAGKWECYHDNGQLASTGRYRLGMRDRKWVYLTPSGQKIESESGLYRTEMALYESRERKYLVEVKDGELHGRWLSWWRNGRVQLEGRYRAGQRHGAWSLWHLDGSYEPEFVSGYYEGGARIAGKPRPEGVGDTDFSLPEELEGRAAGAPDPSALPRLGRLPWVKPSQRGGLREKVERFLDDPDELQRRMAEQLLLQYGRDGLPEVLNRLAGLDLADAADRERAGRLSGLLHGVCRSRGFVLPAIGADEGSTEAAARAVVRWFTWFELARLQDDWWNALRSNQVPQALISTAMIDGFIGRKDESEEGAQPESADLIEVLNTEIRPKLSMLFRQRQLATRSREVREPIVDGLAWLARHQGLDGSWDCDGFEVECARRGEEVCDGPGLQPHDVGVTALALLAFLGDGNTTHSGEHAATVTRGLRWLLAQQDPESGLIGSPQGHAVTYNHALAALVLCEAASFTDSPSVRVPARRAIDLILAAQNPGSGWRYSLTPDGHADTSVTGWMVRALFAAREAELEVGSAAFDGVLAWIDRATDDANGRVGYDVRGSYSSRVSEINLHFPVESGEAMTAAGLYARFLGGQDPRDVEVMERHADLLLRTLPEWAPTEYGCDLYYWAQGTEAMGQMGGTWWKAWKKALWGALLGSQRPTGKPGCLDGSWDPVGPWGYAGGRVYATALAVLCLEGEYRNPRLTR